MIIIKRLQLLLGIALISRLCNGCPLSCICEWPNGKQTVECVNKSLIIIPDGIDSATQVLDISGNNFRYLQREKFLTMNLVNLQKLFLTRCNIEIIQDDAFKGLTSLVELDLSENHLRTVPTGSLLNCASLMKLSLSKNPINSLNRLAFNRLSFLTILDLKGCEISEVHEAAFEGLYSLQWMDLSKNQIQSLPDMWLFPTTLKGLKLEENPWKCDCHLKTLNFWLKKNTVSVQPVCATPSKFKGTEVILLNEEDFACVPEVTSNSFYFEVEEETNLTLICQVKSAPPARITWLFKGQILHNNTALTPDLYLIYYIELGTEDNKSNLFIYNTKSENNGTFYCQAESSAGISYTNYTLVVLLKRKPMTITEDEKPNFPILLSILLAAGLVVLSLCFVALLINLLRCQSKSECGKPPFKEEDKLNPKTKVEYSDKSNFKQTDKRTGIFQTNTENRDIIPDYSYQVPEADPDIINGINSTEVLGPRILGTKVANNLHAIDKGLGSSVTVLRKKDLMISDNKILHWFQNRHRTHPYLKPTLVSQYRPVSAPTFEKFIERNDVRNTDDGYPVQEVASFHSYRSITTKPFSRGSFPKQAFKNSDKQAHMI